MCGIALLLTDAWEMQLESAIRSRGPNHFEKSVHQEGKNVLTFMASVLNLRSCSLIKQPVTDREGNVLLFNGEIYKGPGFGIKTSDTLYLSEAFRGLDEQGIIYLLDQVEGPWSFIYWSSGKIYYGRDKLGRRSLVRSHDHKMISSVCANTAMDHWEEVPAGNGIFVLDLNSMFTQFVQWPAVSKIESVPKCEIVHSLACFCSALEEAVRIRVESQFGADIGILFSGGLDCTVLAALAHKYVPSGSAIDLLNASFERNSPDRLTAISSWQELKREFPSRVWNLVCIDKTIDDIDDVEKRIFQLIYPKTSHMDFNIGTALWFASGGNGYLYKEPNYIPEAHDSDLWEKLLGNIRDPPVEVATNKTKKNCELDSMKNCGKVSKAKCAFSSCGFCCKHHQLNKGVTCKVHKLKRKSQVLDEEKPLELKEEVLVFDAFHSTASVLISGLGADEYLGGYGRHRVSFNRGGWPALLDEIEIDKNRIWERNLGRDDRCISDSGKEVRHPFLDENFIKTLESIPIQHVVDPSLDRGIGEKRILRLLCYQLGLRRTCAFDKRAIQFGTRVAQISNRRAFGSNSAFNGCTSYELVSKKDSTS